MMRSTVETLYTARWSAAGWLMIAVAAAPAWSGGVEDRPRDLAAMAGAVPVSVEEVHRLVEAVAAGRELSASARPILEAQALEEILARRLVMAYARRTGTMVDCREVARTAAALGTEATGSVESEDARREVAWQFQWREYVARYATEQRMEEYFSAHRRELDGTEVSVRHILLRPSGTISPEALDALLAEADRLRSEILAGTVSFEESARRNSHGPSAAEGGILGRIGRRGPMVEAFSAAAFALDPGEVSPPVVTPFGVHLIRCDAIHPGGRSLRDVEDAVRAALSRELLTRLAAVERRHTPVEYTGNTAHFEPATRRLVPAKTADR